MQESFQIAPLTGNGARKTLGDSALRTDRILAPPCLPALETQVQTVMPVRAKNAKHIARGNTLSQYVWHVARVHASLTESLTFERDHIKELRDAFFKGQFVLTRDVQNVSMRSVGALKGAECVERNGVWTLYRYTWQGTVFE
jgi:hypothetical protein